MYATVSSVEALRIQLEDLKRRILDIETWRLMTRHSEDLERKANARAIEKRIRKLETQLEKLTRQVEELARSMPKVSWGPYT